MSEAWLFAHLLPAWMALAVVVLVVLLFRGAPYGRHAGGGGGRTLDARWGWVLMEATSPLLMLATFATGRHRGAPWAWVFLGMWLLHYVHRTLVQPFRWRGKPTPMPWFIPLLGAGFNLVNGYTNGRWLFALDPGYAPGWWRAPHFIIGVVMFAAGLGTNLWADEVLRGLRGKGEGGYRIPQGGLYRWVSCPNYLGEMVEWAGFAVCTGSLPAAAFALWTVANLFPRAIAHHRWYRERFPDYPPERKAVVPFVV